MNIVHLASFTAMPTCQSHDPEADWFPAIDLFDKDSQYLLYADLPGLNSTTIRIDVDEEVLTISGCRNAPAGARLLHAERPLGRFIRRIPLRPDVCREEIQASFQDCTLTLLLPKKSDVVRRSTLNGSAQVNGQASSPPKPRS